MKLIRSMFGRNSLEEAEFKAEQQKLLEKVPIPVVWLFGKTGSGKTSVVRFLTGAPDAEIGTGYRPQTQFSRQFDFPSEDEPLIRFLDTRGLGESVYDPQVDLQTFDASTHVVIVTVRAMDHALKEIVDPLRDIRAARPHRPILLALTWLHEAYPGEQHPQPDPFEAGGDPSRIDANLARSLKAQEERFAGLVDRIVPIDLTRPEEGFAEPNYGGQRLKDAVIELLPSAYRSALLQFDEALQPLKDLHERRAMPYIVAYASMAATAAAVPVPWVDIPVVLGIQSHLVYKIGQLYGQALHASELRALAAAVGGRVLTRLAVRGFFKFMPIVGSAANAALSFAYTFALGKACCWYFAEIRAGHAPKPEDLERVWSEQLTAAAELWKRSH